MSGKRALRWPRKNTDEHIAERRETVRGLPHWREGDEPLLKFPGGADALRDAQECLVGVAPLPVGVVGPLPAELGTYHVDSENGRLVEAERRADEVFVPLAHSEGGLSASLQRGLIAVAQDGRFRTHVLHDRITRDSCFLFRNTGEALALARWVEAHREEMREWLRSPGNTWASTKMAGRMRISRHAQLWEVDTHVIGAMCHILYRYTTGDACGPNMITRNSFALNHGFILERFPRETGIDPVRSVLEANMGGDKKPSHTYFESGGHGKTVVAEATLSANTLKRYLRTTAKDLTELEHVGIHGGVESGMQSSAFTPASAIAALFAATGQDLGMVGTSSMAHGTIEPIHDPAGDSAQDSAGGVHFAIRLPGLEVATVGGGTSLPHAQAYLRMMGCTGEGSVYRLAQLVAAATLALEISASSSMASDGSRNFYEAHLSRGGLKRAEA